MVAQSMWRASHDAADLAVTSWGRVTTPKERTVIVEEASTTLTLIGLSVIVATVGLLMWNKVSPLVAMVVVPVIGAFVAGFGIVEIGEFFESGAEQVMSVVIMFIFAITFFGILSDAGIFDPLIRFLIKATRGNVVLVTVATGLIGAVANIDGSAATTWLITVPALLGLYRALNMSPYLMLLMIALGIGILNMIPWGGPLGRAASVTGIDLLDLYMPLIPLQGVALALLIVLGVLLGLREKGRIARRVAAGEIEDTQNVDVRQMADDFYEERQRTRTEENVELRSNSRWLWWTNVALAIGVLSIMLSGLAEPSFAFLLAVAVALPLNFAGASMQMQRIRAHAPNALMMGAIILGAAVFLGVLNGTGMLESIALSAIAVLPEAAGPFVHLWIGFFGVPMDLLTSTDAYYFSLLPVVDATAGQFGVDSMQTAHSMIIGNNIGTMVSPFAPALWLGLGLAGANMGQHLRYSFLIVWGFSVLVMAAAFPLGILSL